MGAPPSRRLTPRTIATSFAGIFAALALGYWAMLRPSYVPLFTQLRAADTAAIAAELDAKGIPRRVGGGRRDIQVPADRVDDARVLIGGSDIPSKGAVGSSCSTSRTWGSPTSRRRSTTSARCRASWNARS
ncbi:hypothetical protein AB5I41_22720 [Sphingomonas sp. MMS24-JH45]